MSKIIMLLSNPYNPDPRVYKEAAYLVSLGHTVEVLALDYTNRRRHLPLEEHDGILVRRFFTSPEWVDYEAKRYERTTRTLFAIPFFWHFDALRHLLKFRRMVKAHLQGSTYQYVHGHDLSGAWIAASLHHGKPITFDMHEDYLTPTKKKARFKAFIRIFVHHLQNRSAHIIYVHPAQVADISAKNAPKALPLPNYPCTNGLVPSLPAPASSELTLVYAGHILLETIALHKNFFEAARGLPVRFIIYGTGLGGAALQELAEGYDNVALMGGYRQQTDLQAVYAQASASYLLYDFESIGGRWPIATKFYESLCLGVPVIVEQNTGMAELALADGVGIPTVTTDVAAIRASLCELLDKPSLLAGMRASIASHNYRERFSWEHAVEALRAIYGEAQAASPEGAH